VKIPTLANSPVSPFLGVNNFFMDILLIEMIILWVSASGMILTLLFSLANSRRAPFTSHVHAEEMEAKSISGTFESVLLRTKETGGKIARKHVQPIAEDTLMLILGFVRKVILFVKARFDALEDFVMGRRVLREEGTASWYIKNIKIHKDENGKNTPSEEKMRLSN